MSFNNLEGQLARWLERLQAYDFEVLYRKGLAHGNADGLSRRPCEDFGCQYCGKVEAKEALKQENLIARISLSEENSEIWRKEQLEDPNISIFLLSKETGERPAWREIASRDVLQRWEAPSLKKSILQLVVPRGRISQILEEVHDSASGGHFGINKTLEKARKRFYWATCKQNVEDWCRSCKICIAKKGPSGKEKSPLQTFLEVPLEIHTVQGRNFESKMFHELVNLLGIRKTRTTALHPQSDGQVERQHQTISNYIAKFVAGNQKDWDRWIAMYLLAYRSSKHETTGVTPAELYFARDLRLLVDLLRGNPSKLEGEVFSSEGYLNEIKQKSQEIHEDVRKRVDIKSSRTKTWYDQKARQIYFKEGQKVWLYNPRKMIGKTPKFQSNWEGPYFVIKKLSDVKTASPAVFDLQFFRRTLGECRGRDLGKSFLGRRCCRNVKFPTLVRSKKKEVRKAQEKRQEEQTS
ncbi:PREDICTED: uncharacterized protein LOC108770817 [Trachymyrmex cornetzi]|uniref:uncharacterized protein LOC108770817 n=1 Tax=Trachymyrmex cornetzi TaxID=471704 RepID=UPI00084F7590|nr:PREDICTED: uncharacterized protein LOC108770817 [Trachymyrmex cornetzi]